MKAVHLVTGISKHLIPNYSQTQWAFDTTVWAGAGGAIFAPSIIEVRDPGPLGDCSGVSVEPPILRHSGAEFIVKPHSDSAIILCNQLEGAALIHLDDGESCQLDNELEFNIFLNTLNLTGKYCFFILSHSPHELIQ